MKPIPMKQHPEGGRYRKVYKSKTTVSLEDGRERSALTHIYYALKKGEVSCFHKVLSDEVWNLYQGAGVYLYLWNGTCEAPERIELSERADTYCHVIPAGIWQAAEPVGDAVLVGCSVGPGFEYADYELIETDSKLAGIIREHHPGLVKFVNG